MSPPWWEAAELQARSELDPEEYGGLGWDELTDDERQRAIEMVLDDSTHEFYLVLDDSIGKPSWMLGR